MKILKQNSKNHYFRKAVIYLLTYCILFYTSIPVVMATPTGGSVAAGGADITYNTGTYGNTTQVDVLNPNTVINWTSLDTVGGAIEERETLAFTQGSMTNTAVLNRVSGPETQFYGDLSAEGMRIFIINPAGILFGEGSSVNVNQLVASSLGISNEDFLSGNYEFIAGEGEIGGITVENDSTISAAEGVALIGRYVQNNGTIETTNEGGFIVMAAGDRVLLGAPGSNVLIEMSSVTTDDEGDGEVINDGSITAHSGTVILAAGDVYASALELPKVSGGAGRVEQNGTINANGTTGDGGDISLTAADEVILAEGSETTANAGTDADAGLVVAYSKGRTVIEADAQIQATGGHEPHDIDGDFDDVVETTVEISGDYVNLAGDIDTSATDGKRGKIIVDALDIKVKDGSTPENPEDNTIYEEWIEQQTHIDSSTDVELVAHSKEAGNITVEQMNDGIIECGSGDIVLRTKYDTGGITFLGDPAAIHTTAGGNVYMMAGGDDPDTEEIEGSIITGDIISTVPQHAPEDWIVEPGKIRLLTVNGGSITTGQLAVEGGSYDEISVIASGDLTINGDISTYAHQVDEGLEVGQAQTCLVSEHGNVYIDGEISVMAHAKDNSTADIHIDAGQNITINLDGGEILADAQTSAQGNANASVKIHAGKDIEEAGVILITDDGENPTSRADAIHLSAQAHGDKAEIFSDGQTNEHTEVPNGGAYAELDIDNNRIEDCEDCPTPPGLIPPLNPWDNTTHMNDPISGNVFEVGNKIGILEVIPDSSWTELPEPPDSGSYQGTWWEVDTLHGTLFIAENGEYIYIPDEGFVGLDRFVYQAKVIDTGVETDPVEVTITMLNEAPTGEQDTVETNQGDPVIIDVLANDNDPDNDDLTIVIDGVHPQHAEYFDLDPETNTFTYIPELGYVGPDTFTYAITDGEIGAELVWITVTIWVNAAILFPAAPLPEEMEFGVSGCPALLEWTAQEVGISAALAQIWITNTLASSQDIQPCDACANLSEAATVLQDADGSRIAALAQVINEFASSDAPPSEEQMTSVANAIANNTDADSQYALAGEYLDSLVAYVAILQDLGFTPEDAINVATDKYIAPLAEDNVGLATYMTASLTSLGE